MSAFTDDVETFVAEIGGRNIIDGRTVPRKRTVTVIYDGVRPAVNLDGDTLAIIEDMIEYGLPAGVRVLSVTMRLPQPNPNATYCGNCAMRRRNRRGGWSSTADTSSSTATTTCRHGWRNLLTMRTQKRISISSLRHAR